MKRFLAGCLTAGLVLSLAACGNDAALEDPSMTGESVSESEENATIAEVVTDEIGEAVTTENGETVTEFYAEIPVLDESGNVVKDDNCNVVTEKKPVKPNGNTVKSTPFVRQCDILSNRWGDLLCQKEYPTNDIRRNSNER